MPANQNEGRLTGWLCLSTGAYFAAAALSCAASLYGITDFPDDHRGEWAPITVPLLILLAVASGIFGWRRLARFRYRPWQIAAAAVGVLAMSLLWLTWRFAHAAA
ncbi:hypothetical protein [Lysobacter sp. GCM10012299]|uniref:hypothetical protein n=1 Tax=Lysobacter sp. GCM10012299 TaxID=3317333 RepID=UPI0036061850